MYPISESAQYPNEYFSHYGVTMSIYISYSILYLCQAIGIANRINNSMIDYKSGQI